MNSSITVVILTKNESFHIAACIASARWADRVLVFDSISEDETVSLARSANADVLQRPFDNYANQRNAALEACQTEWVFFLDADERISPELASEIRNKMTQTEAGWWVPRFNHIVGHVMRYAGWYPDYQLRLLKRDCAQYDATRPVHEVVLLNGDIGYLQNHLVHFNYDSWTQFHTKQQKYAAYEAQILYEKNLRPRPRNFFLQPLREFWRRYVSLRGWKDGAHGLKLSLLMGYYTLVTYQKLAELWQNKL